MSALVAGRLEGALCGGVFASGYASDNETSAHSHLGGIHHIFVHIFGTFLVSDNETFHFGGIHHFFVHFQILGTYLAFACILQLVHFRNLVNFHGVAGTHFDYGPVIINLLTKGFGVPYYSCDNSGSFNFACDALHLRRVQ